MLNVLTHFLIYYGYINICRQYKKSDKLTKLKDDILAYVYYNICFYCNIFSLEICYNKYGDDEQCEQWARDSQCTANPSWMLSNCAKACDQCKYYHLYSEADLEGCGWCKRTTKF